MARIPVYRADRLFEMSMEIASVVIAGLLLAVWPRRPWQWWAAVAITMTTSVLAVLRTVSDQFTGEGITLVH